jgi:hypothetical protein
VPQSRLLTDVTGLSSAIGQVANHLGVQVKTFEAMMKYGVVLSAVVIGAWIATGSDGALKPPAHPSTNPCTLNKGECYSIQGQSPSADQCVPPMMAYFLDVDLSKIFLECMRGHGNE